MEANIQANVVFIFVIELVLLYLLALIFYYFLLLNRKIKIEDRFSYYTIYNKKEKIKIFDDIFDLGNSIIKRISKFLYKIKIMKIPTGLANNALK